MCPEDEKVALEIQHFDPVIEARADALCKGSCNVIAAETSPEETSARCDFGTNIFPHGLYVPPSRLFSSWYAVSSSQRFYCNRRSSMVTQSAAAL